MTIQRQHTVETASEDGVFCSLKCVCGEERSGMNWEEAGHWFDYHQKEQSRALAEDTFARIERSIR